MLKMRRRNTFKPSTVDHYASNKIFPFKRHITRQPGERKQILPGIQEINMGNGYTENPELV